MEIRVLGPVAAYAEGTAIPLGPRKRRYLLGLLALEVNRALPVERIVDLMWPVAPPRTAVHAVRVCASDLRTALQGWAEIEARGGGYLLRADPLAVDAYRFRQFVHQAAQTGDDTETVRLLDEALSLWHGEALAGVVPAEVRDQLCLGLAQARIAAADDRADALLRLGRHGELLEELSAAVAADPLRERPARQLMLALYRAGRAPEALDAYAGVERALAEEVGLDPGSDLRRLRQQILLRDPQIDLPQRKPMQVPAAISGFAGRAEELSILDKLLDEGARIAAISGTAGVGKTSLALHWAHRVADRFPDGVLHANLRGFDAAGPVPAADVVRDFLSALGVAHPAGPDAQAAALRSRLAGRRMLIVLDNAAAADQVRPVLPGAPGCFVLVTSRHRLTGLVAVDGASPVPLDLPSLDDARLLLAYRLGNLVESEPRAADELIAACARLPLALAVVAARAATTGLPLRVLAADLADLDGFDGGDPAADVRAVLSWSYRAVSEPSRRMFRLLGLRPGPSVSAAAAASAAGLPLADAQRLLRELGTAQLLSHGPRFTSHDLLMLYATELAESDADASAARHRLLDHYLHSANANAAVLDVFRDPVAVPPPVDAVTLDVMPDDAAALAWFTDEYAALVNAVSAAAESGLDRQAWQLACVLTEVFERLGRWEDWSATHEIGLAAARRLGDRAAEARCLAGSGRAAMWRQAWEEAHDRLGQALTRYAEIGDRDGLARTHHNLGYLHEQQGGDLNLALRHSAWALHLFRECGDEPGEARALNAVGWYECLLGRPWDAVTHCRSALDLLRRLGDRRTEALTWDSLAYAYLALDEVREAIDCLEHAVAMLVELGDPYHEAEVADHLGDAYARLGETAAADRSWRRAVDRLEGLGHARAEEVRAKISRPSPPSC
ncbi:DNA-binding SARP family transcriptional activator [Hamadaea flava]|uniref:BTAD domain-containing putative transcriptional regulator n=1 Tax=Hamadaea flava TaxID=1742688 RepID=A0ABV8LQ22_9ACTN|nr:BTAD domain-containing putative transcriptional regulator [Hamadaea flava]MCP2322961.1 DNA-binding SARP family transcriptional activator [Hamadaea flava]